VQDRQIENIALIGFMGTGKSSVAYALTSLLRFHLVDTDELIERSAGKRISEIFRDEGEARFRQLEREVVAQLGQHRHTVIATGGGLGADSENLANLRSHALIVCLWASPEAIWERIRHQSHRPLLQSPDPLGRIRQLLAERDSTYRQADVLINTELRSVREVASQVAHQFRLLQTSA
jgi:shikimate kinase